MAELHANKQIQNKFPRNYLSSKYAAVPNLHFAIALILFAVEKKFFFDRDLGPLAPKSRNCSEAKVQCMHERNKLLGGEREGEREREVYFPVYSISSSPWPTIVVFWERNKHTDRRRVVFVW